MDTHSNTALSGAAHSRLKKGGEKWVTTFEALTVAIEFATLVLAIVSFNTKHRP
jgi:hypothetical protein